MAEAEHLVQRLISDQNADGGWSYGQGTSWAEPTSFAVLALQAYPGEYPKAALGRALSWLQTQQKPSGGWSPHPAIPECTSVTSVAALALMNSASPALHRALEWTAEHVYRDEFSLSSMLAGLFNRPPPHAPGSVPWYPGTAGWVTPTSLSTLALLRAVRQYNRSDLLAIAQRSCAYLMSRRCVDSGWNHGGTPARADDARSYPETTGLALLALRAAGISAPPSAAIRAQRFAAEPQSLEGFCWLQLALQSSTQPVPDPINLPPARTNRDVALRLIALAAGQGKHVLLSI